MSRNTKIKDVKRVLSNLQPDEVFAIGGFEGCIPLNRDAIIYYADEPCVEACQLLYDLNIETFTSGGHSGDNYAIIGIRYDSLSEDNKKVAQEMILNGLIKPVDIDNHNSITSKSIYLKVPISDSSLVGEVSDKLIQLASMFQQQDVLFGRTTIEELKSEEKAIGLPGLVDFKREMMYSSDGITYFASDDLLHKHIEYKKTTSISSKR